MTSPTLELAKVSGALLGAGADENLLLAFLQMRTPGSPTVSPPALAGGTSATGTPVDKPL